MSRLHEALGRWPELLDNQTALDEAAQALCDAFTTGRHAFICGNGGSAADAEHIVGELAKSYRRARPVSDQVRQRLHEMVPDHARFLEKNLEVGYPAFSLVSQTALISAIVNDIDGSMVFAQQLFAYARPRDVFVGLSTSGRSLNVVRAAATARALGVQVIAFTGRGESPLGALSDVSLRAPAVETAEIQQYHQVMYHLICDAVEATLLGEAPHDIGH